MMFEKSVAEYSGTSCPSATGQFSLRKKNLAQIAPETFTRSTDLSHVHILQMLYMC